MSRYRLIGFTRTGAGQQLPRLLASVLFSAAMGSAVSIHGQEVSSEPQPSASLVGELSDSLSSASPRQKEATVTGVQIFSSRVELSLSAPVEFRRAYLRGDTDAQLPDRYYVNLFPATLDRHVQSLFNVEDGPMQRVRLSQFRAGMVRVVLDLRGSHDGEVRMVTNPLRLVIDLDGASSVVESASMAQPQGAKTDEEAAVIDPVASEPSGKKKKKKSTRENVTDFTWSNVPQPWSMLPQVHTSSPRTEPLLSSPASVLRAEGRPLRVPQAPLLSFVELPGEAKGAAPDFTAFFLLPSPALLPVSESESPLADERVFFSYWSWERVCQEVGCIEVRTEEFPVVKSKPETFVSQTPETPERIEDAGSVDSALNHAELNQVGGSMMHQAWLAAMGIGVLLSFLTGIGVMLVWNRRHAGARMEKSDAWETRMAYLEEAVNRAGVLNSSFFHSLEIAQKRLETLLSQADLTEQNLRRLIHQATLVGDRPTRRDGVTAGAVGQGDSFATAALLLAEGEEAQQVARTLKLPLAQVRLLQELRQLTQSSKQEKTADPQEKAALPQLPTEEVSLLTDVLGRLNGTARNGMRFAQNGQSL